MVTPRRSPSRASAGCSTGAPTSRRTAGCAASPTGELVFSESISEKHAGSSFKTMQATAVRDGDDWILNGSKTHVNMGADCDVTLFYAIAPRGLTSFLVDMHLPGIRTAGHRRHRLAAHPHRRRRLRPTSGSRTPTSSARPAAGCRRSCRRST